MWCFSPWLGPPLMLSLRTSFHPITNRKHHCRLCGKIICSLPVKRPQRPSPCSILFVVDPKQGRIEEVGEGVDYGVRKRTMSTASARGAPADEPTPDEKFLKGVRICRDCRPILLYVTSPFQCYVIDSPVVWSRQQHAQEASQTPIFSRLYSVFVELEREIEDALPHFQELLLSLNNDEQPTQEATAARRRLIEAFAQYDAVAKRIRKLPTPGSGSSQDRVQAAILARATGFLQKHMVPLQVHTTCVGLLVAEWQFAGDSDPKVQSSVSWPACRVFPISCAPRPGLCRCARFAALAGARGFAWDIRPGGQGAAQIRGCAHPQSQFVWD